MPSTSIGGWLESHPFMLFNTEDGLIIGFTWVYDNPASQPGLRWLWRQRRRNQRWIRLATWATCALWFPIIHFSGNFNQYWGLICFSQNNSATCRQLPMSQPSQALSLAPPPPQLLLLAPERHQLLSSLSWHRCCYYLALSSILSWWSNVTIHKLLLFFLFTYLILLVS